MSKNAELEKIERNFIMLHQQPKGKIKDTIIQYEKQCNRLQTEVNVLRKAIDKLTTLPSGIHLDLDKHLVNLKDALNENKDSRAIQLQVASLVDVMADLQQQRQDNKILITDFIHQGADLLSQMLIELRDKHAFERMEQLIKTDADERKLIKQFGKLLTECVTTVAKQIEFCEQHHHLIPPGGLALNSQINASFHQIVEHLPLPKHLIERQDVLKFNLEKELTEKDLVALFEELKKLVIDAFRFEQYRFKGFAAEFGKHLRDLSHYLTILKSDNSKTIEDAQQLEAEVQKKIQEINRQLEKPLGSMSKKIKTTLNAIGAKIKAFKQAEQIRLDDYEHRIMTLQDKLSDAEHEINQLKRALSLDQLLDKQDDLTGLPNRASYEEHGQEAFNRWRRGFGDLALALANIDNFRKINDSYGRLIGDKILKQIANLFKSSIRAVDFVARYGDEEFVFVFEHTHPQDAAKVIEGLRNAVESYPFYAQNTRVHLTVSFGLTNFQHGDNLNKAFVRADNAMLQAKRSGRNQISTL
jgi:diguanylate cyclase